MSTSKTREEEAPSTILVVDDESTMREFIAKLIEELGHHAITAKNGADALELSISAGPFTAIVTDVHMPIVDGVQLSHVVRNTGSSIPIIFITEGFTGPGYFYSRRDLQAISPFILMKPIEGASFKKLLASVLDPVPSGHRNDPA